MVRNQFTNPFSLGLDLLRAADFGCAQPTPEPTGPRIAGRVEGDQVQIRAEAPGFGPEDLELDLEGLTLRVTFLGEATEEGAERPAAHEARLRLPFRVDADTVEATFRHGLLEVTLHRTQPEHQRIRITPAE
ncbi:MAG: Hsp20/alpha crystallin family protein [Actinomycetota bacterium]|jgi:HSP20 family molecular chaperone IbpA|nr:Hsp20/alpha crystallin family protein [Actinomycetota bacterium]